MRNAEQKAKLAIYMKERIKKFMHPCVDCGKTIYPHSVRCRSCDSKKRWRQGANGFGRRKKGKEAPCWKGGQWTSKEGYTYIHTPSHPRATINTPYIAEHHLVWESANGKYLPQGWVVHHLNGIKHDNRLANLEALPRRKHHLVLAAKSKRIQELEALLRGQPQLL